MDPNNFTLIDALVVTGIGIAIVFSMLVLIVLILQLQTVVFKKLDAKKTQQNVAEVLMQEPQTIKEDQSQIIAAITAAVYQMLESEQAEKADTEFVVKKITRQKSKQMENWEKL